MACCSAAADVCREDAFTKMAADLEMPEDTIAELHGDHLDSRLSRLTQLPAVAGLRSIGECCASVLERVEEVDGFLVSDVNQASERQFGLMLNHLHSAMGAAAMMGLETLSNALGDLEKAIKEAKQPSGEVTSQSIVQTAFADHPGHS